MLERQINILEAVAGAASPLSASDLVRQTGLPRATIYRNLSALTNCGFVEVTECGNRYILGLRFVKIALTGKSDAHVIKSVTAVMQKLVDKLNETAFFARFRGEHIDLIDVATPDDPSRAYIYPGLGARPAHACSSAKAIAAFILPELLEVLFKTELTRFTDATLTTQEDINRELANVRQNGFALCDGEIDEGITSIAVPVNIDRLGSVFSIGVVGPSKRIRPVIHSNLLPVLKAQAIRAAGAIQHCHITDAEHKSAGVRATGELFLA